MSREFIDSGIDWLGKIPKNWQIQPLKRVLNERNEMNKDGKESFLLSLTIQDGVIPYSEKTGGGNKAKEDITKYKKVVTNDIVINSMNVVVGAAGISKYNGLVSPVYYVFSNKSNSCTRFYNYLFLNPTFENHLFGLGNGILVKINEENGKMNTIRKKIPIDKLKDERIPLPSLAEQIKIADFLDKKINLINQTIENNKKEIRLLKEYKNNKINEVVRRGVKKQLMKNSNQEQLGLIPNEWQIKKFKNIINEFSKGNGITREEIVVDGNIDCIRYGEIYTTYDLFFEKAVTKTNLNLISNAKYIKYGDILFTATGELIEEIGKCVAYLGKDECLAGGDIIIAKHNENPKFLSYVMNSNYAQEQKSMGKIKLKVVHISAKNIGNVTIALPSRKEQDEIVKYLDTMSKKVNDIILYRQQIIEKLEEYKNSLIFEVITGKIEV